MFAELFRDRTRSLARAGWPGWRMLLLAALATVGLAGSAAPACAQRKQPNIIVSLADDMYPCHRHSSSIMREQPRISAESAGNRNTANHWELRAIREY